METTIQSIYSDLYSRSTKNSPDVQKLVSILEATRETIALQSEEVVAAAQAKGATKSKGKGGQAQSAREEALAFSAAEGSPVAYLGPFLAALERTGPTHAKELFFLLARLLPHVPAGALRAKFEPAARVVLAGLQSAVAKDEPTLRSMLSCAGALLCRGVEERGSRGGGGGGGGGGRG
jgi:hypothetical protein